MAEVFPDTVIYVLKKTVQQFGDHSAIIVMENGPKLNYLQLQDSVEGLAAQLRLAGVQPGALVTLAFPNTLEFVIGFLAVMRVRAVAAPLNAAYTEEEFYFYMEDAQSTLLLLPSGGTSAAAEAAAARLGIPVASLQKYKLESGVMLQPKDRLKLMPENVLHEGPGAGGYPKPSDVALFLHTSGTTSRPKGVPLNHANLTTSIQNIVHTYQLSSKDRNLIVMPLFHVHGLLAALLSTFGSGGAILLPAGGKFSASSFWRDMHEGGATWYTAVPTIHQILLARHKERKDIPSGSSYPLLRFIRSCSASLAPATLEGLEAAFKAPVLEAYAMTEASHQMCSNPLPSEGPHKAGSVGKPTGIELTILDSEGKELPPHVTGEICIRGGNVTAGYRGNPVANEQAFAFGWFHTGDQGFLDEEGYLTLTGRIKELINRGGEKISPLEVDAAILTHPAISEAVAFGVPDAHYGEEVNAAVVLFAGETITGTELQEYLKKLLAFFKVPKQIFFAQELPRTATGKIQRRFVAEHFLKKNECEGNSEESAAAARPPTAPQAQVEGSEVAAKALARLGIRHMFGVVGIPVTSFATDCQKAGIRFIAFRNEQAAGYAASACGYLTGIPGSLLTVSGPGCVHGLAGLSGSMSNTWPMVMVAGASAQGETGKGDFQELDQMEAVKPFVKYAGRVKAVADIPNIVQNAVLSAVSGRPGGTYIDIPADIFHSKVDEKEATKLLESLQPFTPTWALPLNAAPTAPSASPAKVEEALRLLHNAQKPLLVIGKGAAFAHAEKALLEFVETTRIPFLATPMGKGVLPDNHHLSASAARSLALSQSDVVLVVGARLNWMLHFGEPPRWKKEVKFILVEIEEKEVELRRPAVGLVGDARAIVEQLNEALRSGGLKLEETHPWLEAIKSKVAANTDKLRASLAKDVVPMNFQCALRIVRDAISAVGSPTPILVSEGANTMDIGRTVLEQMEPRTRLDAGTWGTMGVGMGYAIAAAVTQPHRLVVAVEGDSAFGFSGMEVETICRYDLPIIIIVMNNGGVYGGDRRGHVDIPEPIHKDPPPTSFVPNARYELIMEAFGGKGYSVATPLELTLALEESFSKRKPALINVSIDPFAGTESGGQGHRN